MRQVRIEENLQVGPQRGQLRPQSRHLVGGLGPHLGLELTAQLRLQRQLVFPPRRDLPVQLQVVDELEVAHLGLVDIALPSVDDGDECRDYRSPQREDDRQLE
ncbi:hypothetical protein DQP55_06950 [Mycolicibacterium sp. GF69]|nr:hypothetical protein DQP55_06950 [Mycolicibacterium sp. GF69]